MMKRTKPTWLAATLLAILLVCFFVPSSALAVSQASNDNHTDTDDYCLRAHDVTVGLSEFSSKTRAELESDILSASAFAFLVRDTASGTGNFEPVTSGYSVDFSNLAAAASGSGYVITVTLPAITLQSDSVIHFRVFVQDDLPHPRAVTYLFTSDSAGYTLPADVTAQLPAGESILSGTTVTPSAAFSPVRDGAGQWTFSGWSPASLTLASSDASFSGAWVWTALPVYTVSYEFVSATGGHALPNGVLDKLPINTTGVDGDTITPTDSFRSFHMVDGTWRFHGWNMPSQTIAGGNVTFTGEWRWHKNSVVVTPTPESTPIPTPTPSAIVSDSPQPETTQEPQPVPVLEQIPNDPQPPMANNATGGAQMVIAAVLSALVATQAFAIASDLKVLKWYNAKKAARRAGA